PIPEHLFVHCRSIQISQILLNLLSNAHDAVEKSAAPWVRISVDAEGAQVRIAVIDSGPGVSPALEPRIMEPFFTTKEVGKGTGLGLSVSKGIAESHGGRLSYDRSSAHTRFVLTLPRAPDPPTPAPVQPNTVTAA
ncbi:MAG TPA: ATP-binding protein, partial [Polyangia bacterium]|nr:ATP-binding protein [Polyangia bacterium]